MKLPLRIGRWLCVLVWAVVPLATMAYPPAPHHTFYGQVRDQYGSPIQTDGAVVILETSAGTKCQISVQTDAEPGVNYRLNVPMDAGLTSDLYAPTALRPAMPFKIKVKIGNTVYLPIEMTGDYSHLGQPGQKTLLNLTLGEDSDGDGLPDAWERLLIARLGGNLTLADIRPNDDSDGDGLTNMEEYLAGTYAFDPKNGFALKIVDFVASAPVLEFTAIAGRTYIVYGSSDLATWTPVQFRIPAHGADAPMLDGYQPADVEVTRVEVKPGEETALKFFKLMVQ